AEVLARLRAGAPPGLVADNGRLDYAFDVGPRLRLIVLDLVRRGGGSGGLVAADQPTWLQRQLADAGQRWIIIVSHQPLDAAAGRHPGWRTGDPDLDARPRLRRPAGHDLPRALLSRRPGRAAARIRRLTLGPQRDSLSPASRVMRVREGQSRPGLVAFRGEG